MAKKNDGRKVKYRIIAIVIAFVLICSTYFFRQKIEGFINGEAIASGKVEEANSAEFAVHFVNIGQGDAIYVVLPDGKNMLIDAGPGSSEDRLIKYLNGLDVQYIDYLILTHSDEDHVGGMDKVLETYAVSNIYRPFQIATGTASNPVEDELSYYTTLAKYSGMNVNKVSTACYGKFIKLAYEEKDKNDNPANVIVFYHGLQIVGEGYAIKFYAPEKYAGYGAIGTEDGTEDVGLGFPTKYFSDVNNYSPFILLNYGDKKFAFSGDMEKEGEASLLSEGVLSNSEITELTNVDVFKCGHHGSNTSSSDELLSLISPAYFVASCGKDNKYKHPHAELLSRVNKSLENRFGSSEGRFYRTDENGDVIFYANNGSLLVCCYNYKEVHYFSWFEIAGGVFLVVTVVILCIGAPKSRYKKIKKYVR